MTPEIQTIFSGLFAMLALASACGWWLGRRHPSLSMDNLNARIRSWWAMIAVGGVALLLGQNAVVALFALLSWFALREFAAADPLGAPRAWYFLTVPIQYLAVAFGWQWLALLLIPLTGLVMDRQRWLGQMLCVYGLSFVPALERPEWMLYLVLIVQASDVLQYLWGRSIGRHAIAPRISPSKTVEGLAGGVISATALGAWLHHLTPSGPAGAAALALLITCAGFTGGLVLSAMKRQRQIKDWGTAIAGHGGVLDRVDSLCLSAPVFYCAARLMER
ncbi:MAG: phosphatidate cytidylyltransferase [Acidobacteriota bacterium]